MEIMREDSAYMKPLLLSKGIKITYEFACALIIVGKQYLVPHLVGDSLNQWQQADELRFLHL